MFFHEQSKIHPDTFLTLTIVVKSKFWITYSLSDKRNKSIYLINKSTSSLCRTTVQRLHEVVTHSKTAHVESNWARVRLRSSRLSDTPLFLFDREKTLQWLRQNVKGHVMGWGDSWWPIGKPWCGAHGPPERGGAAGKVNGKGLLQVNFNYSSLKRDQACGRCAKEKTGVVAVCCIAKIVDMLQEILNCRNKDQKTRMLTHC